MSSHLSAIELLNLGDENRNKPWVNQYMPQILGVVLGVGTGAFLNFGTRRPLFSGIQKHVIGTVMWSLSLTYLDKKRLEYYAERDAVLRDYIQLHPEDFPVPERKKVGDVFESWIPIR